MKIGVAQIALISGNIEYNVQKHFEAINKAIDVGLDAVFFSELSITHYEPQLAAQYPFNFNDSKFQKLQALSNRGKIIIAVGVPLKKEHGIQIGLVVFSPYKPIQKYAKQILHDDELPFFISGKEQIVINCKDKVIIPGICFESMQESHVKNAIALKADIYISSVAKSKQGIEAAEKYFSKVSKTYGIPILMVNAVGICDNFICGGSSAIWNSNGEKLFEFANGDEGILVFNTCSNNAEKYRLS